jgi:signal peptidase I
MMNITMNAGLRQVEVNRRKKMKTFNEINQNLMNELKFDVRQAEVCAAVAVPGTQNVINEAAPTVTKKTSRPAAAVQPLWKDLLTLLFKIALISITLILLFTFLFGFIRFQEPSMDPAIRDGDLVIFYRYTKVGFLPQDVIALKVDGERQIRRVVATAGDVVDITDEGGLVINGALQQESHVYGATERYEDGVDFPLSVPEGHVFVLGDMRAGTKDSRIYGSVSIDDTLGKVMTVIRRRSI